MSNNQGLGGKPITLRRGPKGLLFFHGFTSTPQTLAPVVEELAAAGYTISAPLLPGHGTIPEDMAKTRGRQWLAFALEQYDAFAKEFPNCPVAGLSMGGALALWIASQRPVSAVIALAPALYLQDWRLFFRPLLQLLRPWYPAIANDIKGQDFRELAYERYHLKNIHDLLHVMRQARKALPRISAPFLGMQSNADHTLPLGCLDYADRCIGSNIKELHRLTNSYHVLTLDNERGLIARRMLSFLEKFY
jgi:carboxylesterase